MAATWASALAWRLHRQHLDGESADSVEAVVDRLVAVPSWSGDARTAIGLRLGRPASVDLAAALTEGRVLSTYAFRGATHLMTPASAAVHLALRSAGRQWELRSWREHYRLEPDDWPRLRATVREALRDGPLTQHALAAAVASDPAYRHLRSAFEDRSHTFLKPFGWQGDLSLSPSSGGATFRSLEAIPGWSGLAPLDDAGPAAIRAYLGAYGPATPDRIDYWLGECLSAGRARIASWIRRLGAELATIPIEGEEALCLAEHAADVAATAASDRVVLLPGADQWILGAGTTDRRVVPTEHRALATRGANVVLVGGRMLGTWKVAGDVVTIAWLDGEEAAARSAVTAGVERLAVALDRGLEV